MHLNLAAMCRLLDFSVCIDLCCRQVSERGQVFVTRCRGVGVVGALPIEGGERSRNPVEVMAYNVAAGISQREVDEEDFFRA
jgi:hypothetical protein